MAGLSTAEQLRTPAQPVFYYDLGSAECYLASERIMTALPVAPEWEPVLGATIQPHQPPDRRSIERQAVARRLQPIRWPSAWPPETRQAMLAATYAKRVGRAVAFSLAAFRQAFAAGRDVGDLDTVLLAAAACEMHPAAVLKGIELRSVHAALEAATHRAQQAGVSALPAIQVGTRVFLSEEGIEQAAIALGVVSR
jgi:2-hydroxychromene-2-carboxylate isomerase